MDGAWRRVEEGVEKMVAGTGLGGDQGIGGGGLWMALKSK